MSELRPIPKAGVTRAWLQTVRDTAGPENMNDVRTLIDEMISWFPPSHQIGNRDFLEVLEAVLLAAYCKELPNGT